MKIFRLVCLLCLLPTALPAQDETSETGTGTTIVDRINSSTPGKGSVQVIQDNKITECLGRPGKKNSNEGSATNGGTRYVELSGYRIQVFSGNNQRISKNEAYRKETNVKTTFPELSTYVVFNAPFWRLRVGDFQTFQDAQRMMTKLRSEFPAYGREMSIVKEKVKVKVQ
jgi:hypothetical protein